MVTPYPDGKERIEELTRTLENITLSTLNITARQYITQLNEYAKDLSIIQTWYRPQYVDTNEGVVWVAVIPALYFLSVASILGALCGFVWYRNILEKGIEPTDQRRNKEGDEIGTTSLDNRLRNFAVVASNNNDNGNNSKSNDDKDRSRSFVRAGILEAKSDNEVYYSDSIVRSPLTHRGSARSINVFTNKSCHNDSNLRQYQGQGQIEYSDSGNWNQAEIEMKIRRGSLTRQPHLHNHQHQQHSHTHHDCSTHQPQLHHHHQQQQQHQNKSNVSHPINLSITSQSFRSEEDEDDDDDYNDTFDNEDRFSRDSLRTSMESQKLLATGVVEIAPDDLYSMSNNSAYTCNGDYDYDHDGFNNSKNDRKSNNFKRRSEIRRSNKSTHHEICATNSGVENPSFQIETGATENEIETEKLFLEDPIGYLVDRRNHGNNQGIENDDEQNGVISGHVNNTSSVSIATNFQTSSLFGHNNNSYSESFTSSLSSNPENSGKHPSKSPILTGTPFGKGNHVNNRRPSSVNSNENFGSGDATLVRNNYMGHIGVNVGVGRGLPPLPPNHYPRQQQQLGEAPGGPQMPIQIQQGQNGGPTVGGGGGVEDYHRNSGSYVSNTGKRGDQSIFDTSSVLDSSNESGNLSLPSSIARFHASRVQPRPQSSSKFPLADTNNDTPILFADWSPCRRRLDMTSSIIAAGHVMSDNVSMYPNRGSFTQSLDESRLNVEVAGSSGPSAKPCFQDSDNRDGAGVVVEGDRDRHERCDNVGMGRAVDRNGIDRSDIMSKDNENDVEEPFGNKEKLKMSMRCSGDERSGKIDSDYNDDDNNMNTNDAVEDDRKTRGREQGDAGDGELCKGDVTQSDQNPRMKRMISLDWLRSGRVSVERRLRGFGYVRPKGKKTYVETEKLAE